MTRHLSQLAPNFAWILLVPVLAIFFIKGSLEIEWSVVGLLSASSNRHSLEKVLTHLDTMLAQYIWAQLLLAFFAFIAYGIFLLVVRLPYALAVGAIAGVLEFIPIAGPLFALALIMGTAFLTGYEHWVWLGAFGVIWRGIQDYAIYPRVMSKDLDIHPLLAIFAVLVGGEVGGVLGIFLSIPAVATLRILWFNWTDGGLARKVA